MDTTTSIGAYMINYRLNNKIVALGLVFAACCSVLGCLNAEGPKISEKKCIPCRGGVPALKGDDLIVLLQELQEDWQIVDEHLLEKEYDFEDFISALAFAVKVGELAEENQHHPTIVLSYGEVRILLWTHKSEGLTESDFILASKIDLLN